MYTQNLLHLQFECCYCLLMANWKFNKNIFENGKKHRWLISIKKENLSDTFAICKCRRETRSNTGFLAKPINVEDLGRIPDGSMVSKVIGQLF